MDSIYIEEEILDHPRTQRIIARYPKAAMMVVDKHSEVFNPSAQNFRIQKNNPSLILAKKSNRRVLSTPVQYETGGGANYYFSHMLNCIYDCRYCFLQGMYRSANYLLFVNYEDFLDDIKNQVQQHSDADKPTWFFSGYDCDSLAFEPVSRFAEFMVPKFADLTNAVLELRTKSTQIRSLLDMPVQDNVVVAYSLSPEPVAATIEIGAPSLTKRLRALKKLQNKGWRLGIRFDPLIWHLDYQRHYQSMIQNVFTELDVNEIDSVTVGGFRLPKGFYKTMRKLYPEHWLFASGLSEKDGMVAYSKEIEEEMFGYLQSQIEEYVSSANVYYYPSYLPQK